MIDPKLCRTWLALAAALTLGACTTINSSNPVNQEVSLRTVQGGERIEATCEVSNDQARWTVITPVVLAVTRSEKPLTVQCRTVDGAAGTRVFPAIRFGELPLGGTASYSYPEFLELELIRSGRSPSQQVNAPSFAPIDDVGQVPAIDEDGRQGYRRFLAGDSPRAFAISDTGRWARVNAGSDAARLALERCQSYGGRCRLYAVDDQVVWDQERNPDLVAAF